MYQELIHELAKFAGENNLLFDHYFDEDQKTYYFKFQNQERTWIYGREIPMEQLELFTGPIVYFAQDIIDTLKRKTFFVI